MFLRFSYKGHAGATLTIACGLLGVRSALCIGAMTAAMPAFAGNTDYVRELAKNKPHVLLVTSGPQAMQIGQALQTAILRHGDNEHKADDVSLLSLKDAEKEMEKPEGSRSTLIFLLTGKDLNGSPLASTLASLLPFNAAVTKSRTSIVQCANNKYQPVEPIYTIAPYAPDAERLRRVYDDFLARKTTNFREIPFTQSHETNRVAVFSSPEKQSFLNDWGGDNRPNVWNELH